jgi:hypothetical protein
LSTASQAQSTEVVRERLPELRRAPLQVTAAAPFVQQSPNGQFKLSITDNGIELLGPRGGVKITAAGIQVGTPQMQVEIHAGQMSVRSGNGIRLDSGSSIDLKGSTTIHLTTSAASLKLDPATASVTGTLVSLGCTSGKPAARAGDAVNTGGSPAVVAQGSQKVLVC